MAGSALPTDRLPVTGIADESRRSEVAVLAFACPVCASQLRVARDLGRVAGDCPVCGAGVVAPQPEFGCRSMPYRDWLRMQERQGQATPATVDAGPVVSFPVASSAPSPGQPEARSLRWAAIVIAAGSCLIGGLAWLRHSVGVIDPPPPALSAPTPRPVAERPPVPAAQLAASRAPRTATETPASHPPAPPLPPLTKVLQRTAPPNTVVVVHASRSHHFARSAPAAENFLCLKLTDAMDGSVSTRAYVPVSGEIAALIESMLPWGQEHRLAVRLEWQAPIPSRDVAGHWLIVSLDDGTPARSELSSVP